MTQSKMTDRQFDEFLEGALKRDAGAMQDEAAVDRVLTRLAGPLPQQKQPFWRLPSVLLDWQFAPAWPRVAALACCAALGFVVGIAGIDRRLDDASAPFAIASRGDLGAFVFDPEPLNGGRP